MKKQFFTGILALVLVAFVSYGISKNQSVDQLSDLVALQNVEALAQSESGGHIGNFKSGVVWYNSDVSATVGVTTEPGFWASMTANWKSIVCCIAGADIDACNFSLEDPECKRRAPRPSR